MALLLHGNLQVGTLGRGIDEHNLLFMHSTGRTRFGIGSPRKEKHCGTRTLRSSDDAIGPVQLAVRSTGVFSLALQYN